MDAGGVGTLGRVSESSLGTVTLGRRVWSDIRLVDLGDPCRTQHLFGTCDVGGGCGVGEERAEDPEGALGLEGYAVPEAVGRDERRPGQRARGAPAVLGRCGRVVFVAVDEYRQVAAHGLVER